MNKEYSDLELINIIKYDKNPDSQLKELIQRHSGIYLDIINIYASNDSPFIDKRELVKDKDFNIYKAASKYNENKGAKFSTYLGNETKWLCLNTYNKNKRHPTVTTESLDLFHPDLELRTESIKENIKKDLFDKVMQFVKKHPDKRVEKIFNMRYIIGKKNNVMPWKNIGEKMKLSIQGCINIHNSAVQSIQQSMEEKEKC
jgi:DNA-directed RNA polymerase sigma subunit (sigma70/sigma32)